MQVYMPIPYPDELLYSVIARYMIRIGLTATSITTELLFESRFKVAPVELPCSLTALSASSRAIWHMTEDEIADTLTLYPIYSRYAPQKKAETCLEQMKVKGSKSLIILGFIGRRAKVPRYLRYCKRCHDEDISAYGETYWRRSHQIPGLLVCPDHGEWLIDSQVLMRGNNRYQDATEETARPSVDSKSLTTMLGQDIANKYLKVVKRCKDMLTEPLFYSNNDYHAKYRQDALQRGFIKGYSRLMYAELEKEFLLFYGPGLLSLIGCELRRGKKWNWLANIFKISHETHYPIEHALVQIFLEAIPIDLSKKIFGFGPWKCPNPYAEHEDLYPIKKIRHKRYSDGRIVGSARCSCGFYFSFLSMNQDDPQLPVVSQVSSYGESWHKEANRFKKEGLSRYKIGKQLGVSDLKVKCLLDNKQYHLEPAVELINQRRKEWIEIRNSVAGLEEVIRHKKNKSLYVWLSRHDPEWPYKEPRKKFSQPPRPSPINWQERDGQWSELLLAAANRIKTTVPIKRAAKQTIMKEAGIQPVTLKRFEQFLPLSWQVINLEAESTKEGKRRRNNEACRMVSASSYLPLIKKGLKYDLPS